MKSKLFIALIFTLSGFTASAQGIKFGLRAGANLAKVDGKSFQDEFEFGYHLGGATEIMFNKKWGIQPEVLFNQTNTQTGHSFDTLYESINPGLVKDIKLNYLSIPILLTYRPTGIISFQAGPQFGILMSQSKSLLEDGKEAFKNGDFSLVGGVQLQLINFRVYGRYAIGLNNINDIDEQDKWKNQTAQIGVGFMF